ncbi:uracil-DNA glycosylase [Ectothiorhodospiraceae bacterium BW-2]|nr:uracil-DNA glycosylase [Ectothiorhodospiraceae bacterium BW-2]
MVDSQRYAYLKALQIPVWVERNAANTAPIKPEPEPEPQRQRSPPPPPLPATTWEQLEQQVSGCQRCQELSQQRTQTVFGTGNRSSKLLIIGEAPGVDEDRQGEPFVGKAGQLLNAMLYAIGFERSEIYIANTLKCRPPGNRNPTPEELHHCYPFLLRQIELIAPKVILAVGRFAAHTLLQTDATLGTLRGQLHRHQASQTPVIVTYHPAYLLRAPLEKRKSWDDLQLLMRHYW